MRCLSRCPKLLSRASLVEAWIWPWPDRHRHTCYHYTHRLDREEHKHLHIQSLSDTTPHVVSVPRHPR
jgi:hypothetical protein